MFDLDTSIRIVGHVLVAVCVEDFSDWWHLLYATWSCQCSWEFNSHDLIPVYVKYFQPLWRSWSYVYLHHGDSDVCILYMAMTTYVISCMMPLHGHCTLMYLVLLHLLVAMCRVGSLYCADSMAGSSIGFFITPLLGWTYNVFRPSYDPSNLTH